MSQVSTNAQITEHKNHLAVLLVSLVFMLLVVPIVESRGGGDVVLRFGITCVLVGAAVAIRRRRAMLVGGLVVAAVGAQVIWLTLVIDSPVLFMAACMLDSLFFAAMAAYILAAVLKKHLATLQSIYGAVSGYLLFGLAWAMLYWAVERGDPQAFSTATGERFGHFQGEAKAFSEVLYFSFVTMSTLGYGDILPVSPIARTLAWMQSVGGLFYTAVIMAWLVSEMPSRTKRR